MAIKKKSRKDPAFLFYPGDYLRDTQCLSEKSQVAYDRIMCEHMRNISIDMNNITVSQDTLNFFTKRLSDDEKEEIMRVLTKNGDQYQIEWVAISMSERKAYTESRAKNRSGTYVPHMEDEDEDEDEDNTVLRKGGKFSEFKNNLIFTDAIKQSCLEILSTAQFGTDKKVTIDHVEKLFSSFCETQKSSSEWYKDENAVWVHFKRWLPKQKINGTKQSVADKNAAGFDALLEKGKRTFAEARTKGT